MRQRTTREIRDRRSKKAVRLGTGRHDGSGSGSAQVRTNRTLKHILVSDQRSGIVKQLTVSSLNALSLLS